MYNKDRLLVLDADGTTIDAFSAIERTFAAHNMYIGDLERFQKRRHLFKYMGGLKEFPSNIKRQLGRRKRARLIETLTQIYREEAKLYYQIGPWINRLIDQDGLRVGLVTRNITTTPIETLRHLMKRHDVDVDRLDFLIHVPLKQDKTSAFRHARKEFNVNPARSYACGDEKHDFVAAMSAGFHPFMVSYGFEDFERLTAKIGVPPEVISTTPVEFCARVCHALDIDELGTAAPFESRRMPGQSGLPEASLPL
jgi:phosphoglycolate phosphatase